MFIACHSSLVSGGWHCFNYEKMGSIVQKNAEEYAKKHTSALDIVLQEIEDYTIRYHPHAKMLSGHVQGKVLEMLSYMIQPERILEIGTFTGFSALCLVKGLAMNGKLHTIEIKQEDANTAMNYFNKAGMNDRILLHIGDACKIIPKLEEKWDLVFIDADKINYTMYYDLVFPHVKKGGYILADNVLFHGEVLSDNIMGKNAIAIHEFNEYLAKDKRIEKVMLTIRDGLLLIKKM